MVHKKTRKSKQKSVKVDDLSGLFTLFSGHLTAADVNPKFLRALLSLIAQVINMSSHSINAALFRDVVTFLRGPDDGSTCLKNSTTCKIRHAIGIGSGSGLAFNARDFRPYKDLCKRYPDWQGHHKSHYHRAVYGLLELGLLKSNAKGLLRYP